MGGVRLDPAESPPLRLGGRSGDRGAGARSGAERSQVREPRRRSEDQRSSRGRRSHVRVPVRHGARPRVRARGRSLAPAVVCHPRERGLLGAVAAAHRRAWPAAIACSRRTSTAPGKSPAWPRGTAARRSPTRSPRRRPGARERRASACPSRRTLLRRRRSRSTVGTRRARRGVASLVLFEPVLFALLDAPTIRPSRPRARSSRCATTRSRRSIGATRTRSGGPVRRLLDGTRAPGRRCRDARRRLVAPTAMRTVKSGVERGVPASRRRCRRVRGARRCPPSASTGSESPCLCPRAVARLLARAVPRVTALEVEGVGHMGPVTHPDRINALIERAPRGSAPRLTPPAARPAARVRHPQPSHGRRARRRI